MECHELKHELNLLDKSIQELCYLIRSENHPSSIIQTLSFGESVDGLFVPPEITGVYYENEAADYACSAISQYHRSQGQPQLSVHRSPGAIKVSEECDAVIKTINSIKNNLKNMLSTLPRREKNSIIKSVAPGIILKELYRNIPFAVNPCKINCSWVVSGSSTSKVSVDKIIEYIDYKKAVFLNKGESPAFLDADIGTIRSYPANHLFTVVRRTQPHIKYNVKLIEGSWQNIPAHLPLFYIGDAAPSFKPLTSIENIRSFNRKEVGKNDYLIEWLGIIK